MLPEEFCLCFSCGTDHSLPCFKVISILVSFYISEGRGWVWLITASFCSLPSLSSAQIRHSVNSYCINLTEEVVGEYLLFCQGRNFGLKMPPDQYTRDVAAIKPSATTATPDAAPWGNSGYWAQVAEVHIKGMISVSPDSCIFPYIEKC